MHASDILILLLTYLSKIQSELVEVGINGVTEISSAYSFVTLDVRSKEGELLCRIEFEVDSTGAKLEELYCKNSGLNQLLWSKLKQKSLPGLDERGTEALPWSNEIRNSIEQADKIAALCLNCTNGDNYRPGNFSKITILDDRIVLEQVNKMNAKSLDHKKDYSLRTLEFVIPLSKTLPVSFGQVKIGEMLVEFSDNSSENNRRCGERVREELERLAK
jgi:hypothetical protein